MVLIAVFGYSYASVKNLDQNTAASCNLTAAGAPAPTMATDVGYRTASGVASFVTTAHTPTEAVANVSASMSWLRTMADSVAAGFNRASKPADVVAYEGKVTQAQNVAFAACQCPSATAQTTAQPVAQPVSYTGGSPRGVGQRMAAAMGWTGFQWTALDQLWTHESNWDPHVANPGSGAYGIPQSLPADKMASAGADWRTNPATQIRWGLDYIKAAYGDPATAWAKWQARFPHWYSAGGVVTGPWKGPMADNVLAHVTPGEIVIPRGTPAQQQAFLSKVLGTQPAAAPAPCVPGGTAQTVAQVTTGGGGGPAPASFDQQGNPRTVAQALAWDANAVATGFTEAQSHWCDHYAAYAYGWPSSGSTTALTHWAAIPANLKHPGMSNPPAGALVFWRTSAAGHVAISRGDGTVYTTDQNGLHIGVRPLSWYDSAGRVGWAAPDFPGH